jgi:hypothetical protein
MTTSEIKRITGVSPSTLNDWKKDDHAKKNLAKLLIEIPAEEAIYTIGQLGKKKQTRNRFTDKMLAIASIRMQENLFWSNPGGEVLLSSVICKIIKNNNFSDLMAIKKQVGSKMIRFVFENIYKGGSNDVTRKIIYSA